MNVRATLGLREGVSTMTCSNCGTENRTGAKFCRVCGNSLALTCPNGHPVEAGSRFCDECGAVVLTGAEAFVSAAATPPPRSSLSPPQPERRLVSVLFADLVGFTAMSEERDPEEVRELLTRYFDTARRLVGLYVDDARPILDEARGILEGLKARPWLERLARLEAPGSRVAV